MKKGSIGFYILQTLLVIAMFVIYDLAKKRMMVARFFIAKNILLEQNLFSSVGITIQKCLFVLIIVIILILTLTLLKKKKLHIKMNFILIIAIALIGLISILKLTLNLAPHRYAVIIIMWIMIILQTIFAFSKWRKHD